MVRNRLETWGSTTENSLLKDLGGKTSCGPKCGSFGIMQGHGFSELLNNWSKCCVSANQSLCKMSCLTAVCLVDV